MSNNTVQEKPQTLDERLIEKAVKIMEKKVEEQTEAGLAAGQTPKELLQSLLQSVGGKNISSQDVLGQINEIAKTPVAKEGSVTGVIPALFQAMGGKGFHPMAPKQGQLGFDEATKVMQLQQSMQTQQGQIPKTQTDILKNLIDIAKSTGNTGLMEAVGMQRPSTAIETDPLTGLPTEKGIAQKTQAEETAKGKTQQIQKKKELETELSDYFAVGDLVPTADGLARLGKGAWLSLKGFQQDDLVGAATAQLDALNKRLRVKLVRAAGDVGNLNIVEQVAAEKLLYNKTDSTKVRELKKAFLQGLSTSIQDENGSAVKQLINTWVNTPEFKLKNPGIAKQFSKEKAKEETPSTTPTTTFTEGQTATNPKTKEKLIFRGGKWQPMK